MKIAWFFPMSPWLKAWLSHCQQSHNKICFFY
jgi:hypothetical protein